MAQPSPETSAYSTTDSGCCCQSARPSSSVAAARGCIRAAGPSTARIISPCGGIANRRTRVASGAIVTEIGFIVVVLSGRDGWGLHLGACRLAARAYVGRWGQLLGTQIPHAPGSPSPIRTLVIAMIRPPLGAMTVTQASRPNDSPARFRPAPLRAIHLPAVAEATHAEKPGA